MKRQCLSIHLVWNEGEEHSRSQADCFRRLASIPTQPRHVLVDEPERADVLLFFQGDLRSGWLTAHPLLRRHRERSYCYSDLDYPLAWLPGIHVSASRRTVLPGRVQSYTYIAYNRGEALHNPAVSAAIACGQRRYLFSFVGRASHRCRSALLSTFLGRKGVYVEAPAYHHWSEGGEPGRLAHQQRYADVARDSWFGLCPRGRGLASIRLFEMMEMGVAPVIIADGWMPPEGPDWKRCAQFVRQRDIPRLEQILEPLVPAALAMGTRARAEWERWFAPEIQFERMGDILTEIRRRRIVPEALSQRLWGMALLKHGAQRARFELLRRLHGFTR